MLRSAFALIITLLATIVAAPIAHSQNSPSAHQSVLDVDFMDTSVDPCTDFFTYSCGGWLTQKSHSAG